MKVAHFAFVFLCLAAWINSSQATCSASSCTASGSGCDAVKQYIDCLTSAKNTCTDNTLESVIDAVLDPIKKEYNDKCAGVAVQVSISLILFALLSRFLF